MMQNLLLLFGKSPLLNYSLSNGFLPSGLTFARAQAADGTTTAFGSDGDMDYYNANQPRFDYLSGTALGLLLEVQRTNSVRNSLMAGASASPSTLPTYWNVSLPSGLAYAVVGTGIEYGMNYLDLRIYGSSSAGTQMTISYVVQSVAAQGQSWTHSLYARLVGGAKTNLSAFYVAIDEQAGSTYLGASNANILSALGSAIARYSVLRSVVNATADKVQSVMKILTTGINVAVDFTVRLYAPQLELGSEASSFIPTTSSSVTRSADQLSLVVPSGKNTMRLTFDNESTQDISVSAGPLTIDPATLSRPSVKRIQLLKV